MSAADLNNLPINDIKKLVINKEEFKENRKLKEDKQKQKLIEAYLKLKKTKRKTKKGKN